MIDLSRNRAELLAEIEAVEPPAEPLSELTDPRVATADVRVRVHGHAKKDLFPLLKVALSERFAAVSRQHLIRDLLVPLRNALGNAHKHGNARNPDGVVCVEIVLTRDGALIAVTDEGSGFDVALTFRRFQEQEDYCENRGAGFRNLHRARSTVSYENGGRTLLLCFRPAIENPGHINHGPAEEPEGFGLRQPSGAFVFTVEEKAAEDCRSPGRWRARAETRQFVVVTHNSPIANALHETEDQARHAERPATATQRPSALRADAPNLDPRWIEACLSAESPEFGNGQARIESCRVYSPRGPADDGCGNRYVLRNASHDDRPAETRILTGRLHATQAAAEADFEAAKRLYHAAVSKRLFIPKPVGRFRGEPPLVLYDFDPWMNLGEYLTHRGSLKSLCHAAERTGQALAALHRSRISFDKRSSFGLSPSTLERELQPRERFNLMVARVERNVRTLPSGLELVNSFRVCAECIRERAARRRHCIVAPIHGALGWDCIHFGADGRFYLYRFEMCHVSDPGLDLGGFAADLLCFTLTHHNEEAYRTGLDTFLSNYNAEAEHPMDEDDLRFCIALSLVERLGRAEPPTRSEVGQWLEALHVALGRRGVVAAGEVSP